MAKDYKNDKDFKIIELNYYEAINILNFGINYDNEHIIVCDNCNSEIKSTDKLYYVAVLNRALCKDCLDDFIDNYNKHKEDESYENRHYNYYVNILKKESLFNNEVEEITDNDLKEIYEDMVADEEINKQKSNDYD